VSHGIAHERIAQSGLNHPDPLKLRVRSHNYALA
jgi:hypothetical protein